MILEGKVIKLGDNINTDLIISGRYKFAITDIKELSRHIMEDIDPDFVQKIIPRKSIIVAGKNFGLGSSREQAPLVIKEAGIVAVLAKTFARIFYRNAFNIGLPLVETDTDKIEERDFLVIDLNKGLIRNLTKNIELTIKPLPKFMQRLLKAKGIVNYYNKYKRLPEL
ncbi:MAG: 3-isopropylmalate dehydratase small subunit [Candidatus Omnitrophica bacterium]|nr:3-isopropylmalate dehydratase small subunit [Candidatus Omnitrophota bacterium]